ncbi:MAG TPA: hypothetical protein VII25_14020, partial [Candidatus Acidoferrum sp.]
RRATIPRAATTAAPAVIAANVEEIVAVTEAEIVAAADVAAVLDAAEAVVVGLLRWARAVAAIAVVRVIFRNRNTLPQRVVETRAATTIAVRAIAGPNAVQIAAETVGSIAARAFP